MQFDLAKLECSCNVYRYIALPSFCLLFKFRYIMHLGVGKNHQYIVYCVLSSVCIMMYCIIAKNYIVNIPSRLACMTTMIAFGCSIL